MEQVDQPPVEELEAQWREQLPPHFRPIAERHGQELFKIVFAAGMISEALSVLVQLGRGNRQVGQAVNVLQGNSDFLCKGALGGAGKELKDFQECKMDIERAAALAQPASRLDVPGRTSPGGIILDS